MPRYDFECPKCGGQTRVYLHEGDLIAAATPMLCEHCRAPKMVLIGYDADSTEAVFELQLRIAELQDKIRDVDRRLDDWDEIDDTDYRDFTTRH